MRAQGDRAHRVKTCCPGRHRSWQNLGCQCCGGIAAQAPARALDPCRGAPPAGHLPSRSWCGRPLRPRRPATASCPRWLSGAAPSPSARRASCRGCQPCTHPRSRPLLPEAFQSQVSPRAPHRWTHALEQQGKAALRGSAMLVGSPPEILLPPSAHDLWGALHLVATVQEGGLRGRAWRAAELRVPASAGVAWAAG